MPVPPEYEKRWLEMPLGQVLGWLEERVDTLWKESGEGGGSIQKATEYGRAESLYGSLSRVVAWLGGMQPPSVSQGAVYEAPEAFVGKRQRARGRVCFKCRMQVRRSADLMVIAPVQMPGLPVHKKCLQELEEEFGGRA